jgi:hypothetical protein
VSPKASAQVIVLNAVPHAVSAVAVKPVPGAALRPWHIPDRRSSHALPVSVASISLQALAFAQNFVANASQSAAVAGGPPGVGVGSFGLGLGFVVFDGAGDAVELLLGAGSVFEVSVPGSDGPVMSLDDAPEHARRSSEAKAKKDVLMAARAKHFACRT